MATATELLRLVIDADAKGALAGMEAVGASAEKNLGKTDDKMRRIGAGLTTFGAGLATAGAVAGVGLFKLAQMSEDAEQQSRKLANSVANSDHVFRSNGDALRDQAQALQQVTAADADAVIGAQSLLVQFGETEAQVQTLTPLMVDLSRKMGVDLDVAAKAIGKSVDGSSGALKKMGIEVDEAKFAIDPFAATVEALRGTVGGFAEQEGASFNGQLEILKNNLGDLGEAVGGGAAGVLSDFTEKLSGMARYLGETNPQMGELVGRIGAIGSAAAVGLGGLSFVAGQALKLRDVLTVVGDDGTRSLTKMGTAMKGLSIGAGIVAAVWALDAGMKALTTDAGDLAANMDRFSAADSGARAFGVLVERTKELDGAWDDAMDTFIAGHGEMVTIGDDANAISVDMNNLKTAFEDAANAGNFEQLGAALDYIEQQGFDAGAGFTNFSEILDGARERVDAHAAATAAAADPSSEMAEVMGTLGAETEEAADAFQQYADTVLGSLNSMTGMTEAAIDLAESQRDVMKATAEVQRLEKEGKRGTEEYAAAVEELNDANWDASKSAIKQQEAVQKLKSDLDAGRISTDAATAAVADLAASGAITTDQANILSFAIAAASAKADELGRKNPRPTVGADTKGFWEKVLPVAGWDPPGKSGRIDADARPFWGSADAVERWNPPTKYIQLRARWDAALSNFGLGGRAAGGPVSARTPYIVGEEGPELFVPGASGTIVPNHRLGSSSSGSPVGVSTVNITVNAVSSHGVESAVVDALARANRAGLAAVPGVR
jgi:hypothetical protein